MKNIFYVLVVLMCTHISQSQFSRDSTAIHAVILNYIDGEYNGDAVKVKKTIHPNLVKRIVGWSMDHQNNNNVLSEITGEELLLQIAKKEGTASSSQMKKISVFDVYNNSATAKVEMNDWIEYLHLIRWNGEWKIINILWEMKPQE